MRKFTDETFEDEFEIPEEVKSTPPAPIIGGAIGVEIFLKPAMLEVIRNLDAGTVATTWLAHVYLRSPSGSTVRLSARCAYAEGDTAEAVVRDFATLTAMRIASFVQEENL